MKYLKILIGLLVFQFILVMSPLMFGENALLYHEIENQEKERKISQAKMWNSKGIKYYKNKDYTAAIECFRKALEYCPVEIEYINNLAHAYIEDKKFDKALQFLNGLLDKFSKRDEQKKLQIVIADVHFWWAENFRKKNDYLDAIKHYETAYNINKLYLPRDSAVCLNNIGLMYSALGENNKALEYYKKALKIMRAVGDRKQETIILDNTGDAYNNLNDKNKALEYYHEALQITQAIGPQFKEASTLHKIGEVYSDLGMQLKGLEYYEKALAIMHKLGDRSGEARILYYIGEVNSALGDSQKALEYYKKALPIAQVLGDKTREASILQKIGDLYTALGDNQKALDYYEKIFPIIRPLGEQSEEAQTLYKIGLGYYNIGQKEKALKYFEKALPILQFLGNRPWEIGALNNIGRVYSDLGEKQKALGYYEKALPICREVGYRLGEANTLNNIAAVYSSLGDKQKALEYFQKALSIFQALSNQNEEASTLNNIAAVYFYLGEKQKALEYYLKALPIFQAVGDRFQEAETLNNIGLSYSALGDKKNALAYYEKVLPLFRILDKQSKEAAVLDNIGRVYDALGDKQKALEYYEKALPITQAIGDRSGEAAVLNNIGILVSALGDRQKALEYLEKALSIFQTLDERFMETTILNNIGEIYDSLGQEQKALEYLDKALQILQEVGDRSREAATLGNIGHVYFALGDKQKALEYHEKALSINQALGNQYGAAVALGSIGVVYSILGQKQKALEYYNKALPIFCAVGDRSGEAQILTNIGLVYSALGKKKKTQEHLEKSLLLKRAVGDREREAITFHHLMYFWESLKRTGLSIFYGKQSVNTFQELRTNISGLKKEFQRSYLERRQHTYRILADLLIKRGRLLEAQQVLDMLKEEEFFSFILKDRSAARVLDATVDFTEFERQWIEKYNVVMKKLAKVSREHHVLKFKKNKNDTEKKWMEALELELKTATKSYEDFLAQMRNDFGRHEKEIQSGMIPPDVAAKEASELQETLKELDEKEDNRHAALHYLVYKGRISVILTTPASQLVKHTKIDENEFNRMVMDYRNFMMEAGRGVHLQKKPPAIEESSYKKIKICEKCIYNVMFKAVDEELKKHGATNMVVSLDGVLRYLPLGALWDGESYLLQRYRIAIVTPSSLKNIKGEPIKEKKILGLGASQGSQELPPLPNVPFEIRSIVKDEKNGYFGLINGKAFIDDDFTRDTMIDQLKSNDYPLVHIASHFRFSPGDETKNHLLLGDGTFMKLSEIRRMGKLFNNVKLLVLSACQTGVGGNGEEIDGFGELAQQSGAKSVVASLWPVADESTKDLMMTFYGKLKEGKVTSKIEALRQAQLELSGLEDLLTKDKNKIHQSNRQKTEYSHPYYWGPFIMMGNWR